MIGISALTEFTSDESDNEPLAEATKEAKESEAFALYHQALQEQRSNNCKKAEGLYHSLLQSGFLEEVEVPESAGEPLVDPAAILKYSAYKNLGNLALERGDQRQGVEYLLEAVSLDSTDVSLWYRIGQAAVKLMNLPLANISLREGLRCNPNHWPSLDCIVTVTYTISDYSSCLFYVAKILEKDAKHLKAHAFKFQILQEDAYYRRHADVIFKNCPESVHNFRVKKDVVDKYISVALKMREERRKLAETPPLPVLKFRSSFKEFTWWHLGEQLIQLYDYLCQADPHISFGCRIDLSPHIEDEGDSCEDPRSVHWAPHSEGSATPMETGELSERQSEAEGTVIGGNARHLSSSESHTQTTDVSGAEMEEVPEKSHKSHKKKRGLFGEPAPGKRRSARVRNTEKKKEVVETVDYYELLQRFLPFTLVQSNSEDPADIFGSPTSQPKRQSANASHVPDLPSATDLAEVEGHDVEEFMQQNAKNCGVASLMRKYLVCLSKQFHLNWPRKLTSVYMEVYNRMRKHITIPAIFFQDDSDEYKRDLGAAMLVYMELCVDKWRRSKTQDIRWGKFVQPDMVYLQHLSVMKDLMGDTWPEFPVRVNWMRARYFVLDGKTAEAVNAYNLCHDLLETFDLTDNLIHLPNIHEDKVINKDIVEGRKDTLRRTQSHEEITRLFEEEEYERVVDVLLAVIDSPRSDEDEDEQLKQRRMLVMALLRIGDHKNLVVCFCKILKEFWDKMQGLEEQSEKVKILRKLDEFFDMLVSAPALSTNLFQATNHRVAGQLAYVLIDVIAWTMRNFRPPEEGAESHAPTVLPWAVLYFLLKSEEDRLGAQMVPGSAETVPVATDDSSRDSTEALLPSSIMLLETAHENLGRKSWCCNSEGAFLKLTATVLLRELNKFPEDQTHPFAEDLQQLLEQCFYCLYRHPNRRAKAKHLQDHAVEEVPLTWEYGKFMFNYFKPRMLPEFDGYKTSAMSGDLESLFLRVTKVIPARQRPEDSVEKIQAYVDGTSDDTPVLAGNIKANSPVVSEIFYLLADYYFKNKEFGKATKFYIHDICFCPNRLDSWAGLALAKSGRLELKLNSCDAKAEGGVYKQGMGSLRCFHRALEIDQSNRSLWIEYGSFAYILQSHASRQLKHRDQLQLSEESIEGLKVKQGEMLTLSEECYRKVKDMRGDEEGEEWLVHYMLGKIAEKRGAIKTALDHYLEAMDHLYNDGAKFPKKISYHNPPDLALESLEMYFRIHAAVLKSLEGSQSDLESVPYDSYEEVLHLASIQPIVRRQEKKLSELSSEVSTDEHEVTAKLTPPPTAPPILIDGSPLLSPPYVTAPQDHDYALIKKLQKRQPIDYEDIQTDTPSEADAFSSEESAPSMEEDSHAAFLLHKLFPHARGEFPLLTRQLHQQHLSPPSAPRGPAPAVTVATETKEGVAMETGEVNLGPGKEEGLSPERRFGRLVTQCLRALSLCLQRFPQHYKSLYRITHWYLKSRKAENLQWCYDLLLGNPTPWQQVPHMPAPALFGEHSKTKNIFQGIWRIPIADIDRSGSFSWHMYRSVTLLIDVLEAMKDDSMLLQMATKLARTPEQGKKFLRDSDRPHLALRAFHTCQGLLAADAPLAPSLSEDGKLSLLMKIWNTLQVGQQLPLPSESDIANKALVEVYRCLENVEISDELPILDQAVRTCQQAMNTPKTPQVPYQSDTTRTGRSGPQSSPVRPPGDRPLTSAQYLEKLYGVRSPGSLGLTQAKRSPDGPLGGSFMMSRILAADSERNTGTHPREGAAKDEPGQTKPGGVSNRASDGQGVTQGEGGSNRVELMTPRVAKGLPRVTKAGGISAPPSDDHKVSQEEGGNDKAGLMTPTEAKGAPSVTKTGGISAPPSDKQTVTQGGGGRGKTGLSTPSAGPSTSKAALDVAKPASGLAKAGMSVSRMTKKLATVPPTGPEDPEKDAPEQNNKPDEPGEAVSVGGLTRPLVPRAPLQKTTDLFDACHSESRDPEGRMADNPWRKRESGSVRGSQNGSKSVPGGVGASPSSSDTPHPTGGGLLETVKPPPGLPKAPRPDLGQHLNSLLQKVRTGLKVTNKASWRKVTASPSHVASHPAPAGTIERQREGTERGAVRETISLTAEDPGAKSSGNNAVLPAGIIRSSASEEGTGLPEKTSVEGSLVTKSTGLSTSAVGVPGPIESTVSEPPDAQTSDDSETEKARFDAILNSLKSSGGKAGGSRARITGGVSHSSAMDAGKKEPDELAEILNSLESDELETVEKITSTSEGSPVVHQRASEDERPSRPGMKPEEGSNTTNEERNVSLEHLQRGGGEVPKTFPPGSGGPDSVGNTSSPSTSLADGRRASKASQNVEGEMTTLEVRPKSGVTLELTDILSSLALPKTEAPNEQAGSCSTGVPQTVTVAAKTAEGRASSTKPPEFSPSSATGRKRPLSFIELWKSLKRPKGEHKQRRKDLSESTVPGRGSPRDECGRSMSQGLSQINSKSVGGAGITGDADWSSHSGKEGIRGSSGGDSTTAPDKVPLSEPQRYSPTESVSPVGYLSRDNTHCRDSSEGLDGNRCDDIDEVPLVEPRETLGSPSDTLPLSKISVGSLERGSPSSDIQGPVYPQGLETSPRGRETASSEASQREGQEASPGDVPVSRLSVVSPKRDYHPSHPQGPDVSSQGPSEVFLRSVVGKETLGKRKHSRGSGDEMEGSHTKKSFTDDDIPLCELGNSPLRAGYSPQCLTLEKTEGEGEGEQTHESPSDNVPLSKLAGSEEIP